MARSFPFHRPARHPADQAGFLLPLALCGALVMLLSSLSLSAMALQARQLQAAGRSRSQSEDQLASAAHQLAAALQGPYRCLLTQPSSAWLTSPLPSDCPAGLNPQALQRITVAGSSVLLRGWTPNGSGSGGVLWLQAGESGPEHRYALTLQPAQGLQEVG